ncbi:hypothetical protein HELRODRAFT_159787 [Helobdella robusta]|uniref:Uncharacterized protein n=1 Tax=Helobdella robusta TaxID=6412 RepID=T1EPE6_HELRO|nr:hypothetical protein HELRODRAFT_159787 [Helobdella robusta]ESO13158.1 hypothetical protein HELRODRAFT_159787 [Helobdella robusta]
MQAPLSFLMRIFSFSIPRAVFLQQSRRGLVPDLKDNVGTGRHSSFCLCGMDDVLSVSGQNPYSIGTCQMMVGAMENYEDLIVTIFSRELSTLGFVSNFKELIKYFKPLAPSPADTFNKFTKNAPNSIV